jgi:hypothetical protein
LLGGQGHARAAHNNDVDLEPDQFGHEFSISLRPLRCKAGFDDDGLALDVTVLTQPPAEWGERCLGDGMLRGRGEEQTDPRDFGWRLCIDGERSSKDRNRSRNERALACHWITSSARASTDGGIVRPRHTADHRSVGDRLRLHQGDGVAPEPTARRLMEANMPPHDRGHGKMSYLRQTILPRDEVHPPARLSPPARTPHL